MKLARHSKRLLRGLLILGGLALALTLILRKTNTFSQAVELPLYDTTTKLTWPWTTGHPDIVLVTIQDAEQWPLSDGKLADILGTLSSAQPKVIAIDLIRDSYRSADPVTASLEAEALDIAFSWNGTLLAIEGLTTSSYPGFDPPPYFQQSTFAERQSKVGLANFPRDEFLGLKVRRGLFKSSQPDRFSLPALAAIYAAHAINPEEPPSFDDFDRVSAFTHDDGGYALTEKEIGSQFLLKFGPNMDTLFPEFSMAQVENMTPEELLKNFSGKVVFFGTGNSETAKDEIPVIGNSQLRGVKLLALATAQLIRELTEEEEPIHTSSTLTEISLIILATFFTIAILFFFRLSGIKRFFSLLLIATLLFVLGCLALKSGMWIPTGAPITAVFLTGAFGSLFLHRNVTINLQNYSSTLKQQFGDQVARVIEDHREELLEQGTLPKRTFQGSAFFCDLLGFTAITEDYAKEETSDDFLAWINDYLGAMIPIIRQNHGVIVKFAGDGIFVVFGFPDDPDHADQAVQCCRQMETSLRKLNRERSSESPPYFARAGIYTGPIFAGPVGSRDRLSYDFLGSTINKAARLESYQKETYQPQSDTNLPPLRALISAATYDSLQDQTKINALGDSPSQIDKGLTKKEELEQLWEIIF